MRSYRGWYSPLCFTAMGFTYRYCPYCCSVSFSPYLKNWRYFGVKLFGTVWDIMGLHEQNRVLMIGTKVLFYMRRDIFWGHHTCLLCSYFSQAFVSSSSNRETFTRLSSSFINQGQEIGMVFAEFGEYNCGNRKYEASSNSGRRIQ